MSKKILVLLIALVSFINVYAESKNVTVKYQEKNNTTVYSSNIVNKSASFYINNQTINVKVNATANSQIKIIRVTGDALNWISSSNSNYYYIFTEKDNEILNNSNIYEISTKNRIINAFNTSGQKIASEKEKVNTSGSEIYFSLDNIPEVKYTDITLNIAGKGRVIINGDVYTSSTSVKVLPESIIIVVSDSNYIFSQGFINSVNITDHFINNQMTYTFKDNDTLNISFNEIPVEVSEETYSVSGYITKNGIPVQNAKVILHSEERVAYTNEQGYYEFENVENGEHEILVLTEEETALGYMKFVIEKNEENKLTTKREENKVTTILLNNEANEINMDISVEENYNLTVTNVSDNVTKTEEGSFNPLWLFLLAIPIVIIIIIFLTRKKQKD